MKRVLMVVYSFPPINNAGTERAVQIIEQLNKYGWDPFILTHKKWPVTEAGSAAQAPDGVDIVRSGTWASDNLPRFFQPIANLFASLLVPDKERLWELFCTRKAVRMTKYEGVDLIYTLSPPTSAHLVGLHLKRKYPGVPWVADVCEQAPTGGRKTRERYIKKLMGKILVTADCITTGSQSVYENLLTENTGIAREGSLCYIPDNHVLELSEQFEKACRAIAIRKIAGSGQS